MHEIIKYFPDLPKSQSRQLELMSDLYMDWNQKINVISRKDMDQFYIRHVLHSLAIAKYTSFVPDTEIMDFGTGGGFPGIPLAILYPHCKFLLVDSIEKKVKVVDDIIEKLNLKNAITHRGRAEDISKKFDFVTCRAVAKIEKLIVWTKGNISSKSRNVLPNGLLAFKGGDLKEEMAAINGNYDIKNLTTYFNEDFFETKKLVYVPIK